jgi:hypothetical protein
MRLPLRVPPDSLTDSEVASVLPRDRTSAVTTLFEASYVSLVRMARLLRATGFGTDVGAITAWMRVEQGAAGRGAAGGVVTQQDPADCGA